MRVLVCMVFVMWCFVYFCCRRFVWDWMRLLSVFIIVLCFLFLFFFLSFFLFCFVFFVFFFLFCFLCRRRF